MPQTLFPLDDAPRRWVPAAYIDEISPPPRPSPGDWLVTLPDDPCTKRSP